MKIVYSRKNKKNPAADAIRSLLTAWLAAASLEYWLLGSELGDLEGLEGIAAMSGGRMIRVGTAVFLLLWLLRKRLPVKVQRSVLAAVTGLLMGSTLISSFTWPCLVICLLLLTCVVVYAARGWQGSGAGF